MITRTQSYQTSNGQVFGTLEEAQRHELGVWIQSRLGKMDTQPNSTTVEESDVAAHLAMEIQQDAAKIIDILTTTATSKPKARRVNGGTKKRGASASQPQATQPPDQPAA